jgi:HTH-type transcriptional regulator / antitoxin HigA
MSNEFIPAEVFPPGEFLADEIQARGWTQVEFAKLIRRPTKVVNEIIAGKKTITTETARELAAALGTSPQYWLNLETAYQLWKTAPSHTAEEISREAKLRERFPVRELARRGWIRNSQSYEVIEKSVFDFYGITSIDEEPRLMAHAARRNYENPITNLQEAWLFRVKQLASIVQVAKYSEKKLREALGRIEPLMLDPEGVRQVPEILSSCGVRFVIVEPIPGSQIDGVCFWLDGGKSPVIGLTLKWDFIDRFWFNLRHEIEHVLRGDGKEQPVVEDFESDANKKEPAEIAANNAAGEFCLSRKMLNDFVLRHDPMYSTTSFLGFSKIVKRHPGIVAGQLQWRIGRPELFKKFQVRVRELIIDVALTDGYGRQIPDDI